MGAYNLYKGQHACHNQYLLNDILRGEWGFDGVVVSDWGGTHDTDQAITNGLDMEFGSWTDGLANGSSNAYDNYYLAMPYLERIKSGKVGTKELDEKVRRILRLAFHYNGCEPSFSVLSFLPSITRLPAALVKKALCCCKTKTAYCPST